jgi:hypothetical protein
MGLAKASIGIMGKALCLERASERSLKWFLVGLQGDNGILSDMRESDRPNSAISLQGLRILNDPQALHQLSQERSNASQRENRRVCDDVA